MYVLECEPRRYPALFVDEDDMPTERQDEARTFGTATEAALYAAENIPFPVRWKPIGETRARGRSGCKSKTKTQNV